ncbi:hypothetical protein ABPG74_008594 [Tetrahymena malaccensis]
MKVKKIFNPQKTISEIIKQVRASPPQEQKTILSYQLEEIKKELKASDPKTLQIALQKLFFLKMEGVDLRQLDFLIVNCLSCSSFGPKKMACLQVPVSIDPSSQSLFMATNLFKKEIMKSNHVEVSCILSCVTNIVTTDMGPILIEDSIKILKSNKPILRKKAMALVAKIFQVCPQTIQGNLENILDSIILKEDNPTVLACFTSIVNSVLNVQPKLFPLFVKPLYELLNKQKSNWFLIKMVKTFHKMIRLEPRLVKKLQEIYSNLLTTTNSKALEYELLNSVIEFFKDDASLYELACEKVKIFIEHDDANLQSLGFNLLNKMISTNLVMINEYKSFLMETLDGTSDAYTKLQILDIFQNFMNKSIYEDFIEIVLKQIVIKQQNKTKRTESAQFMKLQRKSISCIIACTKANDYEYVSDYDWLIETVVSCLSKNVLSAENALEIQNMIYDIMVRIDGLSKTIFSLSYQVISELSHLMLNQSDETFNYFRIKTIEANDQKSCNSPITAQEIIFQTFMFIVGEFSQLMKDSNEVMKLLNLLNNVQLLQIFEQSSYEIQTTLLKCIVKYSQKQQNLEKNEEFQQIILKSVEILIKLQQIKGINFELDISQNLLLRIVNPQNESLYNLIQQIPSQIEKNIVESISNLNSILIDFEPIHPDAQKYIVPQVDLNEPVQKNQEEIDKITQKCKEFLSVQGRVKEQQEQNKEKSQESKEEEKVSQNGENKSDENNPENGKTLKNNDKQIDANPETTELAENQVQKQEPQQAKYTVKKFQMPSAVNGGQQYNALQEENDADNS